LGWRTKRNITPSQGKSKKQKGWKEIEGVWEWELGETVN